jgi:hypothetical protein
MPDIKGSVGLIHNYVLSLRGAACRAETQPSAVAIHRPYTDQKLRLEDSAGGEK